MAKHGTWTVFGPGRRLIQRGQAEGSKERGYFLGIIGVPPAEPLRMITYGVLRTMDACSSGTEQHGILPGCYL